MDAHTWNTYHIISNRARSVCYATRQQQFRRQTEMAVNKLSTATIEQLQAMEDLASSQHHIKQTTEGSLKVNCFSKMTAEYSLELFVHFRVFKSIKITSSSHKEKF